MNKIISVGILFFCLFPPAVYSGDVKLAGMGNMVIVVPDIDAQVNLYQLAGNIAGLKTNDSLNWMRIEGGARSIRGDIRRHWDSNRTELYHLSFFGQKHLDDNMVFFGQLDYLWDHRYGANQAIEKTPYALDPFVLADSNSGHFTHYGPRVYAAFCHNPFSKFYWGLSIEYFLSQGLKNIYTMPEIISREITISLDAVYQISPSLKLGFSYRPYHFQDNTKLVTLPDKSLPITYRYRGEYEFRKHVGTADRHAEYSGFELIPQISFHSRRLEAVLLGGYYYQWHELYDDPAKRLYDGYYQGEHYFAEGMMRYHLGSQKQTILAAHMKFRTISDWAKHPENDLLFYQADYLRYNLIAGLSHRFVNKSIEAGAEIHYYSDDPDRRDYLAQVYRKGINKQIQLRTGAEVGVGNSWFFRGGIIYHWYEEDPVWQYFGNYDGPEFTFGAGYHFNAVELNLLTRYGRVQAQSNPDIMQRQVNIRLQLHQSF